MLTHLNATARVPKRVVVLGCRGFVGSHFMRRAEAAGAEVCGLGRETIDLTAEGAAASLRDHLRSGDSLVFVSAMAPCKTVAQLTGNLMMAGSVLKAIDSIDLEYAIYVSSDAVYMDSSDLLSEESARAPDGLHGVMHLAREISLRDTLKTPLGIIRPSLLYGAGDPHNGYGPNRFFRQAMSGQAIRLFGNGEERRDHVAVQDVAELIWLMLTHQSSGTLNAATGVVTSFLNIATLIAQLIGSQSGHERLPRVGGMPHNGYRAFDPTATYAAFPDFQYTDLEEGLARMVADHASA